MEGGRAALAVAVLAVHFAQLLLPEQLAPGVQAVEPARAEEREQQGAVGDRRGRGQAAGHMPGFVRQLLVHRLLPENLAVAAADGQDHELVVMGQGQVVMGARAVRKTRPHGRAIGDGRGEEDAVPPNDRRGMPLARQSRFPADVLALAPHDRRLSVGRHPGGQRSPPLWPEVLPLRRAPILRSRP